jgi:hypothetical protein
MTEPRFTVETARVLADVAHFRQKDKLKRPYTQHVHDVGDALADFDEDIQIAGYLHDIAEDTPISRQALLDMGVSIRAVNIIERVSLNLYDDPDDYAGSIQSVAQDHDATLVKIADNAHNSLPERVQALAEKWPDKVPTTKYSEARRVLYRAVPAAEVRLILHRINPSLLPELEEIAGPSDGDDITGTLLTPSPAVQGPADEGSKATTDDVPADNPKNDSPENDNPKSDNPTDDETGQLGELGANGDEGSQGRAS